MLKRCKNIMSFSDAAHGLLTHRLARFSPTNHVPIGAFLSDSINAAFSDADDEHMTYK
jgi:hypothetical protein